MSKLINTTNDSDALTLWELHDQEKRKRNNLKIISEKKEKSNIPSFRNKAPDTPQNRARKAELLAMKAEIELSMLSKKPVVKEKQESKDIKRRKEILNIKRVLQGL